MLRLLASNLIDVPTENLVVSSISRLWSLVCEHKPAVRLSIFRATMGLKKKVECAKISYGKRQINRSLSRHDLCKF